MLHDLLRIWFHWVEMWGYAGVFILMAMESSIIPVPSEVVMPPAAFWAAQGRMSFAGVVLAGTAGSYFGSLVSYWVARWVGKPLIEKYGKFVLVTPDKVKMAELWIQEYGAIGVFFARFLPVVRHLVSIPAGILRMPQGPFGVATIVGAGAWCAILSWFGMEIIGSQPELLASPEAMILAVKSKMLWFLGAVLFLIFMYGIVLLFKFRKTSKQALHNIYSSYKFQFAEYYSLTDSFIDSFLS